jgi:hypothetical protein
MPLMLCVATVRLMYIWHCRFWYCSVVDAADVVVLLKVIHSLVGKVVISLNVSSSMFGEVGVAGLKERFAFLLTV